MRDLNACKEYKVLCCEGSKDEVYLELVQGLGEALVGNLPGSAFRVTISKSALSSLAASLDNQQKLDSLLESVPNDAVRICAYPSKSLKLILPDEALASKSRGSSAFIFRSDSNGEDLEGYAAAQTFVISPKLTPWLHLVLLSTCTDAVKLQAICDWRRSIPSVGAYQTSELTSLRLASPKQSLSSN